jgi:hypothetical protein
VDTGFQDLDLAELVALTLPHNAASRGVMEKVGFTYDRDIVHAGLAHVLYRLARPPGGAGAGAADGGPPGALLGCASPRRQPL